MSFDFDPDAKLNQIGARFTVNNLERDKQTERMVDRMIFDRMCGQLASILSVEAMRRTEGVYSTDYEIRLYVLTPDQLEKYVQRRAERLGYKPAAIVEQVYER
jgi:hypothetical protein